LKNAIASVNSFYLLGVNGLTSAKDIYTLGYNLDNNNGNPLPVQLVRINLTKKNVQNKTLPGITSAKGNFWISVFDPAGNVYLSVITPRRTVFRLNLKDSIKIEDIGNVFSTGTTLAYSASLGRDGKIYFGGSSGGTYWSSYDPLTKKLDKHPEIDPQNDYVLSIAGDTNFVYAQTGQRNSVQLWSIRKKDEFKKMLCKITNRSRIDMRTFTDGIYVSVGTDTLTGKFKLVNGSLVKVAGWPAAQIVVHAEINTANTHSLASYFDGTQNKLFFSVDKKPYESVDINTKAIRMDIRRIFSFPNDKENIYYVGDYYGNYYRYDLKTQTAYLLGSSGQNIYSTLPVNDSIIYFSGYPSGYIMRWNRKQPWTTQKFINGKVVNGMDANANPKLLAFWKGSGNPPAGFHHTFQMLFDVNKNLIGAGNVIRIGNAASIGVYNPVKNTIYGINYEQFTGMLFSGIANWRNLIVYSMSGAPNYAKLYFYDPSLNKMVDSINAGFDDYGSVYINKNTLTGVANNRIYKLNLLTRKVTEMYSYPKNSIRGSFMLSNGTLLVNSTQQIPPAFCSSVSLPYTNFHEANGIVYAIRGNMIVRVKGLVKK
jgi:hypothetical protein